MYHVIHTLTGKVLATVPDTRIAAVTASAIAKDESFSMYTVCKSRKRGDGIPEIMVRANQSVEEIQTAIVTKLG